MALKRKRKIILVIATVIVAGLVLFLKGPYASDFLKSLVLPQAQAALGRQVTVGKMSLNLIPLYVEAREVKVLDEEGEHTLTVDSVKAYLNLSEILDKEVTLNSIVVKKPQVRLSSEEAKALSGGLVSDKEGGKKEWSVKVNKVIVSDGEAAYSYGETGRLIEARGINAEVSLRERTEVDFSLEEINADVEDWPLKHAAVSGDVVVGKESVEIKRMNAEIGGSSLSGTGQYSFDGTGELRLDIDLLVDTLKQIRGLKESGYGSVRARGTVSLGEYPVNPHLDFDVKGDFYLQTLLEFLKARTSHRLTGLVSFDGSVEGPVNDLNGRADSRLRDGNLYTVDVEDAKCTTLFVDNVLRFTKGKGIVYGGRADFEVSLQMPKAYPYSVDVDFEGVDSPPALERIGMSWLDLPFGKVRGKFQTAGRHFSPNGWAEYEVVEPREDPIGRIRRISGKYDMVDKVVTMSSMEAETAESHIDFSGIVDIKSRTIDIDVALNSDNIKEWTTPFYDRLSSGITFNGKATGTFDDPLVAGKLTMSSIVLDEYPIGDAVGEATYRKNLFTVTGAKARHNGSTYRVDGKVEFPNAQYLLELGYPVYDLRVGLADADLDGILKLHKLDVPAEGTAKGKVSIKGSGTPVYSGTSEIADGSLYGFGVSLASLNFSYDFETFRLRNSVLRNGDSEVMLNGSINADLTYEFAANSDNFNLKDAINEQAPINYKMKLKAEGKGSFDEPQVTLNAELSDGYFKSRQIGGGKLKAELNGKEVKYDARVFRDRVSLKGAARLEEDLPWEAELKIDRGRFDFLATAFLDEVPEDMLFNVSGKANLFGTRTRTDAEAKVTQVTLAMFGQSFSNDDDIEFTVEDGKFYFPGLKLRSGNTSVNFSGYFKYDEYIDAMIHGNSSLAPLKVMSDKINLLRGNARYVLAMRGDWDSPEVNGGLDVTGGAFGLAGVPQRLAEIDGYAYFEGDTLVIQNIDAKLGGGDIELSGVLKFKGLQTKSANIDMLLKDVNLTLASGFKTNLGGNIIYRASPDSKLLTGEVVVNSAEYTDRIEWRSWLLKVRQAEASVPREGALDDLRLSVRLYGDEDIIIDNNVARAKLEIDTVLRGTVGEPLLLGRVKAADGKVYFRNSEFSIVRATADFSDTTSREPYVDIVAETSVKGYNVWLTLEGRPEQLDMTLISDPELEDEEILALLTVGEFGERLRGLEGGIGAAEASSVLTGQFQDVVEERMRELTGISRFTIDPYVSRRTGSITPRLTVSKRLGSENLFVTYSSSMSTAEEQEVKLEYVINRNVSLLGGQDDLGTLGGDVRFRFFFK